MDFPASKDKFEQPFSAWIKNLKVLQIGLCHDYSRKERQWLSGYPHEFLGPMLQLIETRSNGI